MRSVSLLDAPVTLPGSGVVTRGLVMGNRWPLAVAYLGPAWVASGMGENRVFVAAMLLGRLMFQILEACPASRTAVPSARVFRMNTTTFWLTSAVSL